MLLRSGTPLEEYDKKKTRLQSDTKLDMKIKQRML
jgi:hypothetical protein